MRMKCNNNWSPGFSPSNIVISNFFQFVQYFHFCTTPWASAPLFWLVHEAEAEDVWRHSLRLMDTVYLLPWEQRSHNLWNEPQLGVNTTTLTRRRTKMTSDGVFLQMLKLNWSFSWLGSLNIARHSQRIWTASWGRASGPSPRGRAVARRGRTRPRCVSWGCASAAAAPERCSATAGGAAQTQRSPWRRRPAEQRENRESASDRLHQRSGNDNPRKVTPPKEEWIAYCCKKANVAAE